MAKDIHKPDERVMDQLRKIASLAERGYMGELAMARSMLERKLKEYGLTVEDLYEGKKRACTFRFSNKLERRLLVNMLLHRFGSKSDEFQGARISRVRRAVYVDLTELDYIEFGNEYGYYRKAFARELEKTNKAFLVAFVNRFDLFDITPSETDTPPKEMSPDELRRALEMLGITKNIEAYPYRKEIAAGAAGNRREDYR